MCVHVHASRHKHVKSFTSVLDKTRDWLCSTITHKDPLITSCMRSCSDTIGYAFEYRVIAYARLSDTGAYLPPTSNT